MQSKTGWESFKKKWKEVGELGSVPGSCDCLSFAIFAHSLIHRLTPFGGRVSSLSQELLGTLRGWNCGDDVAEKAAHPSRGLWSLIEARFGDREGAYL